MAAMAIDTHWSVTISTVENTDVSTINCHLKLMLVTRTTGFVDGQNHLPTISIR
jgi:hypothetical protein